jgi:hypothetical protein
MVANLKYLATLLNENSVFPPPFLSLYFCGEQGCKSELYTMYCGSAEDLFG